MGPHSPIPLRVAQQLLSVSGNVVARLDAGVQLETAVERSEHYPQCFRGREHLAKAFCCPNLSLGQLEMHHRALLFIASRSSNEHTPKV